MHERIRLINHQGKKVALVDLSKCPANIVETIVRQVPEYVTVRPLVRCCWRISRERPLMRKPSGRWRKLRSSTTPISGDRRGWELRTPRGIQGQFHFR